METQTLKIPEIQVSYHRNVDEETISTSRDAYVSFAKRWNNDSMDLLEEFMVLYLSRKNSVIGHRIIGRGGTHACYVDVRIILGVALKCNCSGLILGHNHPSGSLRPSEQDITLTEQIHNAALFMGIKVYDHIILTSSGFFSFCDEGLIKSA